MAKLRQDKPKEWKGRTDGLPWMIRSLVVIMKVVDRHLIYIVMALVVPFYMVINHKGYLAIYRFFRQRFGYGAVRSLLMVYVNHFRFGQVIVDRYAAYAGKRFRFAFDGNNLFLNMLEQPGGFIQLSSHVGNYEMTGYSLTQSKKRINGLFYGGETSVLMEFRRKILGSHNVELIEVDNSMSHLFSMNAALDRGEIISMTGDRMLGSSKSLSCSFMGDQANFPMGPFALAVQKEVPIVAVFTMRHKWGVYKVHVRRIEVDSSLAVRGQMQDMAQRFATLLEEIVREYPAQWFNFYDFWKA